MITKYTMEPFYNIYLKYNKYIVHEKKKEGQVYGNVFQKESMVLGLLVNVAVRGDLAFFVLRDKQE